MLIKPVVQNSLVNGPSSAQPSLTHHRKITEVLAYLTSPLGALQLQPFPRLLFPVYWWIAGVVTSVSCRRVQTRLEECLPLPQFSIPDQQKGKSKTAWLITQPRLQKAPFLQLRSSDIQTLLLLKRKVFVNSIDPILREQNSYSAFLPIYCFFKDSMKIWARLMKVAIASVWFIVTITVRQQSPLVHTKAV